MAGNDVYYENLQNVKRIFQVYARWYDQSFPFNLEMNIRKIMSFLRMREMVIVMMKEETVDIDHSQNDTN